MRRRKKPCAHRIMAPPTWRGEGVALRVIVMAILANRLHDFDRHGPMGHYAMLLSKIEGILLRLAFSLLAVPRTWRGSIGDRPPGMARTKPMLALRRALSAGCAAALLRAVGEIISPIPAFSIDFWLARRQRKARSMRPAMPCGEAPA